MPPVTTERLIGHLVAELRPVRRLRPPLVRAGLWLAAASAAGLLVIAAFADLPAVGARLRHGELYVELAGTLLTGSAAVLAAFELSLPDRSRRWALLPAPFLGLWLAGSGLGCYRQWLVLGRDSWRVGESWHCLLFILGAGLPLGAALLWSLRKAGPFAPRQTLATGALGAAALAAFLLQFFHSFDVTLLDLAAHALAVALVILLTTAAERRLAAA